jgi:phage gp29-like protein
MPVSPIQNNVSKNKDRYVNDESYDLTPAHVLSSFQSANAGVVKRQSRIANELTEKDPAISQAWSVRVAAIASCPWEVVGGSQEERDFINRSLRKVQPAYDSGLVSFHDLLQFMQSAVMQGFALSRTMWREGSGRTMIEGFELYAQALFSYQNSDLPYFTGPTLGAGTQTDQLSANKIFPKYPEWIYHTATNSRSSEPLRSGIVRPLAYLYTFSRHINIEYMSGLEKYGNPQPFVGIDDFLYDDENEDKQALETMLQNWTYNQYALYKKGAMEVTFPTADSGFDVNNFLSFLEWNEKQKFRIILGQDSTSSADNSNRSTAQVHNLVRGDMLASDAKAIEETVNNQIIKPLYEAQFGVGGQRPIFRFRLKGVTELQEMANVVETLDKAGYEVDEETLSQRFGFNVVKKEEVSENGN